MKNNYLTLKYLKLEAIIGLIMVLAGAIILAKYYWGVSLAIVATITLILSIILKKLWNTKAFKWMFWVDDFSGEYRGKLRFKYIDEIGNVQIGEREHVKCIVQDGSNLVINSFTIREDGSKSSASVSKGVHVEHTSDGNHFLLIYNYLNDGSAEQGFPPHYGTEVVKFIKKGDEKVLSGGYYTNREPFQTRGEFIDLKRVSNNNGHAF